MAEDTDPKRIVGRIVVSMLLVGLGVGLVALLTWEWIDAVIVDQVSASQRLVIGNYTPLVFIIVTTASAAVSAAMLGVFEGLRTSELKSTLFVALGCLIGAVLLVVVAGLFINFTGLTIEGADSAETTPLDLVSLAGLAGVACAPIGALTSVLGAK